VLKKETGNLIKDHNGSTTAKTRGNGQGSKIRNVIAMAGNKFKCDGDGKRQCDSTGR
jgi:hypothetical protein